MICWIIFDVDVSPFLEVSVRTDYLYSVGDKRVESFSIVVYVIKYYFGVGPKLLFQIDVVQFFLKHHADFR